MDKQKEEIVKVAGLWEIGWNTPIKEVELWEFPLRDFEIDGFYMTPVSGIQYPFVKEMNTLDQVIEENPDLTVVFVDEGAETPLTDFVHPKKALYILGKTSSSPFVTMKRDQDLAVRIETKAGHSSSGLLWAHQAITVVLYDRLKKSWQ